MRVAKGILTNIKISEHIAISIVPYPDYYNLIDLSSNENVYESKTVQYKLVEYGNSIVYHNMASLTKDRSVQLDLLTDRDALITLKLCQNIHIHEDTQIRIIRQGDYNFQIYEYECSFFRELLKNTALTDKARNMIPQ